MATASSMKWDVEAHAMMFQFGSYVLDPDRRALHKDDCPLHLTPKEFDILLVLLEHSDRAVSRDELIGKVWPGITVEDSNLTQNIFLLRKALGETATGQPHIETIPKRGYRVAVPVKRKTTHREWRMRAVLILSLLAWSLLCYWIGRSRFP